MTYHSFRTPLEVAARKLKLDNRKTKALTKYLCRKQVKPLLACDSLPRELVVWTKSRRMGRDGWCFVGTYFL